jgi:hypothetical protein
MAMRMNAQCTICSADKRIPIIIWTATLIREKIMRIARISRGPTGCSRDILRKAKGGLTLIESPQIRRFLRWSVRGGWSLWSKARSLNNLAQGTIRLKSTQVRRVLWWPGVRLVCISKGLSARATLSQAKAKGNYHARVHLDQIVLVTVRREAGSDSP